MTTVDCTARLQAMLNNVPPQRVTLESPYPKYTQFQLDMRRKAEVLQYKRSATKTNNPTKKQQFAQAVSGRQRVTPSLADKCAQIDAGLSTPLPASFSGVPGGGMLFYDPAVPLYNYTPPNPSYSKLNPPIENPTDA
jgi:hypothetical protein